MLAQRREDVEVIVVNDGSTDNGPEIVSEFVRNSRLPIRLVHQANSGGPSKPRNVGIEKAVGRYVAFLDPDDYWLEGKLDRQLAVMSARPDVAMSFNEFVVVDQFGLEHGMYLKRVDYTPRMAAHSTRIADDVYVSGSTFYAFDSTEVAGAHTSGVLVRRDALLALDEWFPTTLRVGEDRDLWFRIAQSTAVAYIDKPLHAYRIHDASLMHQASLATPGAVACHERNYARAISQLNPEQMRRYRDRIAGLHAGIGYNAWRQYDMHGARKAYAEAWNWNHRLAHGWSWLKACSPGPLVKVVRRAARR